MILEELKLVCFPRLVSPLWRSTSWRPWAEIPPCKLHAVPQEMFKHYDKDDSGDIDSFEALQSMQSMLCFNAWDMPQLMHLETRHVYHSQVAELSSPMAALYV